MRNTIWWMREQLKMPAVRIQWKTLHTTELFTPLHSRTIINMCYAQSV